MEISPQFVRSDNVVSRVVADETLLVPVRRGTADLASLYSFNSVGNAVWEALATPRTVDELVVLVAATYEVSPDKAREDLLAFLQEAQAAGLIQPVANERR